MVNSLVRFINCCWCFCFVTDYPLLQTAVHCPALSGGGREGLHGEYEPRRKLLSVGLMTLFMTLFAKDSPWRCTTEGVLITKGDSNRSSVVQVHHTMWTQNMILCRDSGTHSHTYTLQCSTEPSYPPPATPTHIHTGKKKNDYKTQSKKKILCINTKVWATVYTYTHIQDKLKTRTWCLEVDEKRGFKEMKRSYRPNGAGEIIPVCRSSS